MQKGVLDLFTKSHSQRCGEEEHRSARIAGTLRSKKKRMVIQNTQNKPWRNEELKECEEVLPRLKEGDLEKASRLYKAKTGVRCDGFHPIVPLECNTRDERNSCGILGEGGTEWQMAATSLHDDVFLDTDESCE